MNKTVEFLRQTRDVIATSATWCQRRYAVDKDGRGIDWRRLLSILE